MKRCFAGIVLALAAACVVAAQPKPAFPAAAPQPAVDAPLPAAMAAVKPKEPYDSTKGQLYFEKMRNQALQAAQLQAQYAALRKQLQDEYEKEQQALDAWTGAIRKANGWDGSYRYDGARDEWTHTPATPAAPAKK